ncbi:MAG: LPXTG cell wall anchor domain-containing protein [Dehalococcoidia bacterium]
MALGSSTASANQFCLNLKGQLCVTLTPDPATNPVDTDHTVTAAATVDGDPLGAVFDAGFAVYDGPNAGQTGVVPLGAGGTADFTYSGSGGAGTDSIVVVLCDIAQDCQGYVDGCAQDGSTCLSTIAADCQPQLGPARVSAAGIQNFCIGPATAVKNWEDPTPTPSPTPFDVNAGGQSPAPTPAQLPASGGTTGNAGTPWTLVALIGAVMMLSGGGALVLARRRVTDR